MKNGPLRTIFRRKPVFTCRRSRVHEAGCTKLCEFVLYCFATKSCFWPQCPRCDSAKNCPVHQLTWVKQILSWEAWLGKGFSIFLCSPAFLSLSLYQFKSRCRMWINLPCWSLDAAHELLETTVLHIPPRRLYAPEKCSTYILLLLLQIVIPHTAKDTRFASSFFQGKI